MLRGMISSLKRYLFPVQAIELPEDCISIILSYSYPKVRLASKRWNELYETHNSMKPLAIRSIRMNNVHYFSMTMCNHIMEYYDIDHTELTSRTISLIKIHRHRDDESYI